MKPASLFILIWCMISGLVDGGLYDQNDAVVLLDHKNFHNYVLNKENGWIIQFYNTWCGHCQHFAPLYKRLALDIKDWKHTVMIGVVDCAEDTNSAICREYDVAGYPTVLAFPAFIKKGDIGLSMPNHLAASNVNSIEKFILDELTEKQATGNGSESWSNLQYSKRSISDAIAANPSQVNVAIFEPKSSIVGRQVILDLHFMQQVRIMRIYHANESLSASIAHADGAVKMLNWTDSKRDSLELLIAAEMNVNLNDTRQNGAPGVSAASVSSPPVANTSDRLIVDLLIDDRVDQVYIVDIENVLSFLFRHEFALHKRIEGESLVALKHFVKTLRFCLPTRPPVQAFLGHFHTFVSDKVVLKGEELAAVYDHISGPAAFLPQQQAWIGCLGSEPKFRGYPCGLWTTFHVLTVSHCEPDERGHVKRASDVLAHIDGFVRHFFSCGECSRHFHEMYAGDAAEYVRDRDDVISWLWKSHNRVNHRLRSAPSEDPAHKKIPFPDRLDCPRCWTADDQFDEGAVLKYLKRRYSAPFMSRRGVVNETSLLHGTPPYQGSAADYEWHWFALMYAISSATLVCCFILLLYKCKRKAHSKYRFHIL